jgi:hypothetical protein
MCYGIFIRRLLVLSSALLLLALLPGAARAQMPPEVARALESEADYVAFMQKFRNTFTFSTGHNAYTCRQYLDLRRRLPEASVAWMGVRYWGRSQNEYLPCDLVDFLHRVAPAPQPCYRPANLGQELFERMEASLVTNLTAEGELFTQDMEGSLVTFAEFQQDWSSYETPLWPKTLQFTLRDNGLGLVATWKGVPGREGRLWDEHEFVTAVDADGNGQCDWIMREEEDNLDDMNFGPFLSFYIVLNPGPEGFMEARRLFSLPPFPAVDFILPDGPDGP